MDAGDVIMVRSRDFEKAPFVHFHKSCGHQTWTVGRLKVQTTLKNTYEVIIVRSRDL